MQLWPVAHFFFIKIRFSCNQKVREGFFYIEWMYLQCFDNTGKSNFDEKKVGN